LAAVAAALVAVLAAAHGVPHADHTLEASRVVVHHCTEVRRPNEEDTFDAVAEERNEAPHDVVVAVDSSAVGIVVLELLPLQDLRVGPS
jgi:16S rRNA U1498 N3-methylase RsmE